MKFKKLKLALVAAGAMLMVGQASATNWLKLQGTEIPGVSGRAKVWGFLQPTYQKDFSTLGPEPTRIGPNLETQEQFQLFRARIGVRGIAMPLDSDVNYFVMFELGDNGSTDGGSFGQRTPVRMMDASVTMNHLDMARVRFGLFKTPGPEEIYQGIPTIDYINFSWVGNQLMLERFSNGITNPLDPVDNGGLDITDASWDSSFGAARDTGVQVFDWFKTGDWTHSYAIMYGNGNGLEPSSGNSVGMDTYLYWASEKNYSGGLGPWVHGWKTYAWSHSGKRSIDLTDDGASNPTTHDRTRYGFGTRYRKGAWRVGAEFMGGKGMIFQGPDKPYLGVKDSGSTTASVTYTSLDDSADGYVLDLGYYVPGSKWELDLRWDVYNRSKDNFELSAYFERLTYGAQYHFNLKSKLIINYEVRKANKVNAGVPGPLGVGLGRIGDRLGIQVTTIF